MKNLWNECQNEVTHAGEYHTYEYSEGQKKFRMGFIIFNQQAEFVSVIGFDDSVEFADMMGSPEDTYEALDDMEIGDSIVLDDTDGTVGKIIRIW